MFHKSKLRFNQGLSNEHLPALVLSSVMSLVPATCARKGVWEEHPRKIFDSVLFALA